MSTLTKNKKPNAFVRLTKHSEFTIGLVVIVLFLVAAFGTSNFLTKYNLMNLTKQGAIIGVLAVAQTFIIIPSGIDISGGAIAGIVIAFVVVLGALGALLFSYFKQKKAEKK